jgi:hypothetical protein
MLESHPFFVVRIQAVSTVISDHACQTERPLEQGNSKPNNVGEKKQKKKRKRPVNNSKHIDFR